jgi:alkylation response protein AidB-like acyl-CoA dehydrogenase
MTAPAEGLAGLGRTSAESELLTAIIDSVQRFAAKEIRPREIDRDAKIPQRVLAGLAELGLFGLSIPEEHGGAGLSLQGVCSAVIALARLDRAVATTVGLHLGLGTRGLVAYGSPALKAEVLPGLASGRRLAAFAATEPGAGSDLTAISTKIAEAGPGRLRVDGTKVYVTNGGLADVFTIAASSPGLGGARRGHSLLLLDRGDKGLTTGPEEHKLGLKGSSTTGLTLEGVEVPAGRVIGEAGRGMEQLHHVLAWGRTAMAAGCIGTARAALEATAVQVTTRKQFGKPLAAFEVVRGQLADLAALHFAMEALVRWTAAAEENRPELGLRSAAAKVFCSEADWEICDLAIQLHGGAGFIEETGLPLLLRDARITRIFEGANDVLLVAQGGAEAGPRPERKPLAEIVAAPLSGAAVQADQLHAAVLARRAEIKGRYGLKLLQQQRQLHRLGRLSVLRDASDAAVLRAAAEGTAESCALAAHFVALARGRALELEREPPALAPIDAAVQALLARHT